MCLVAKRRLSRAGTAIDRPTLVHQQSVKTDLCDVAGTPCGNLSTPYL
jgi:hypothetical protein